MKLNYVFIYYFWSLSFCNGYRIFAIFPMNGRSHFSIFEQIVKGLAEKGHQVDVISGFPLKEPFPNYTDIVKLPKTNLEMDFPFELFSSRALGIQSLHWACRELCHILANPEVAKIIKNPPNDPPYDLVLTHVTYLIFLMNLFFIRWNVNYFRLSVKLKIMRCPLLFNGRGLFTTTEITCKNEHFYRESPIYIKCTLKT